jgi:hypothetical protein
MKRVAEFTLDDVVKYARLHESLGRLPGPWLICKAHTLNAFLESVSCDPGYVFHCDKALDLKLQLWVDEKHMCGTLGAPNVAELLKYATAAGFGRGEEAVYDETVRRALAIDGARLSFRNVKNKEVVSNALTYIPYAQEKELKAWCGVLPKYGFKLYKLHMYPTGGHFDTHVDTPHGTAHLATAIAHLSSAFEGGALVVEHAGQTTRINSGLGAWFSDCPHRVEPVTSGTRIVLQYDILNDATFALPEDAKEDDDDNKSDDSDSGGELFHSSYLYSPEARPVLSAASRAAFVSAVQTEIDAGYDVALALQYRYLGDVCDEEALIDPTQLKGMDRLMWELFSQEKALACGIVACVVDMSNPNDGKAERTIGPLTDVPGTGRRVCKFVPGGTDTLFKVFEIPSAEHTGNEPADGSSRYLGAVLYCTAAAAPAQ